MLQCVAVCCSVLQSVIVFCSVLQCIVETLLPCTHAAACCSVLHCVAAYRSDGTLACVAMCFFALTLAVEANVRVLECKGT